MLQTKKKPKISQDKYLAMYLIYSAVINDLVVFCPCHHGMARPQVADGETAPQNGG
jgi:hypothetical protein